MSWLTDRWGQGGPLGTILGAIQGKKGSVNALRNDVGNIVQVGSDVAAPFTGPFAPLVAGAGNALGSGIKPGTNIGDIAKSGGIAAGVAGLGEALTGGFSGSGGGTGPDASASPDDLGLTSDAVPAVSSGMNPGASSVAQALGANAPSTLASGADDLSSNVPFTDSMNAAADDTAPPSIPVQQTGIGAGPQATDALSTAAQATPPSPLGASATQTVQNAAGQNPQNPSLVDRVLKTIGKVPANLAGNALTAIGNAPLNEARAKQIALENQLVQQQIAKNASLDPLRQALATAFQKQLNNPYQIAKNPYNPTGGITPNPYTGG